ncbi:MAG: hypothetical protein IPP01_05910 [Saprospiraceae bacterium]|nr:hypothetical protein [Saprospiraceae bacterium]
MNSVMYPEITGKGNSDAEDDMDEMNKSEHDHHQKKPSKITTLNYAMLKSPSKTSLQSDVPVKELRFELTGNMNRYVWSLDNK